MFFQLLPIAIGLGLSISLAIWADIFRRENSRWPLRMAEREQPLIFLGIAGFGLMAFALAPAFVIPATRGLGIAPALQPSTQAAAQAASQPATQPATQAATQPAPNLTDAQLAIANATAEFSALAAMVAITILLRPNEVWPLKLDFVRISAGLAGGFVSLLIIITPVIITLNQSESVWEFLKLNPPKAHEALLILQRDPQLWLHVLIIFTAVVLAPLAEEFFFRGCIQNYIRFQFGSPDLAVVITSLLFAATHPWWSMPAIFVLALGLGYAYERTGNLWTNVFMHAMFNLASVTLFQLSQ